MTDRITFRQERMGGMACIRNTRITVAAVVRCVANGMNTAEILAAYPDLEAADIVAALEYAASLTEDRVLPLRPTGS
jgi:uncharacterized protein (DUF433 family)